MTKEVAEKIARGITDKIECNTVDIDDWAEFWGFTREEYEEFLDMAIKALEQQNVLFKSGLLKDCEACMAEQEPCYNPDEWCHDCSEYNHDKQCCPRFNRVIRNAVKEVKKSKTGHWSRKTKVDAYDIAGVKTWGIKCQCDRCDFTTIVVEDFGYYKFCPNCGCRMVKPQESEEEE